VDFHKIWGVDYGEEELKRIKIIVNLNNTVPQFTGACPLTTTFE